MNKGDLLRCIGILTYVVLTIIDRFCFNIADYIHVPLLIVVFSTQRLVCLLFTIRNLQ